MEVEFANDELERLANDPDAAKGGWRAIIGVYRRRIQFMKAAPDERDFYAMKSLHFEKLKGSRSHQRSMRLNDQWRLILEVVPGTPKNTIRVIGIEDYH